MPLGIRVEDLMSEPAETIASDASIREVAERLRAEEIGSLVVVDGDGPTGIITDADLVGVLADGVDPETTTVADVMSSPVHTVDSDESVVTAVERLRKHDVPKLPVLTDGELVGVVTTTDLSHYLPQVVNRRWLDERDPESQTQYRVRPETAYEREDWEFETITGAEEGIRVGDRVEFSKVIDDEDVREFAEASGDTNRLHLDDEFAAETRFGRRIVHGTLVGSLISAALARLPGLTIYLSQDLSFQNPVDIGDRVTATCRVVEDLGRDRYVLSTDVHREDGEPVIEGEAVVVIDDLPAFATPEREPVDD